MGSDAYADLAVPVVAHGQMNRTAKRAFGTCPPLAEGLIEWPKERPRIYRVAQAAPDVWFFADVTQEVEDARAATLAAQVQALMMRDPSEALRVLAGRAWRAVEVWLLRGDVFERDMVWVDHTHEGWRHAPAPTFKMGHGFPGRAASSRQIIRSQNLESESQFSRRNEAAAQGFRAGAAVPLLDDGAAIGAVLFLGPAMPASDVSLKAAALLAQMVRGRSDGVAQAIQDGRVRAWAEAASDAFVSLTKEGKVLFASRSMRTVTGRGEYDFIHREFAPFVHPDDRAAVQLSLERSATVRFRLRDAADRWLEGTTQVQDDEVVLVLRDVTARVQTEDDLRRSNLELEQFAYAASHDLQAPLRAISGYLQILEMDHGDKLDDDARNCIARSVGAAERMRSMVNALLMYSRVETRGHPLEDVDLQSVVQVALDNLGNPEGVTVDPLPRVMGDKNQLAQVFQNLIENARKFGGTKITIDASAHPRYHIIRVTDDGPGIPANQRDRIFRIFQRLHRRDEHPGTGIGLALCRRIMDRHAGAIELDPNYSAGARFLLRFPIGDS